MSTRSRDEIIHQYYPLVQKIAYRLANRMPNHIDVEDLIHVGVIGLMEAVDRYNPDQMASFDAYLKIRLQGAMVDELRRSDWVPRSVRDRVQQLEYAISQFYQKHQRKPSMQELAQSLDISESQLESMQRFADIRTVVSIEERINEDMRIGDFIEGSQDDPLQVAESSSISDQMQNIISNLPERERIIVDLYYFQEYSFKEIAAILKVTESRISQLHSMVKQKLRRRLSTINSA